MVYITSINIENWIFIWFTEFIIIIIIYIIIPKIFGLKIYLFSNIYINFQLLNNLEI